VTRCALLLLLAAAFLPAETLFDGRDLAHFRTPTGTTGPEVSWRIANGVLESIPDAPRQCDLWTLDEYENFDFSFEWMVSPKGNSGIKYLIQDLAVDHLTRRPRPFIHETSLGYEFQLLGTDPASTPLEKHVTGSLYGYLAPTLYTARQPGEWNTGRLVVNGRRVEHWVNGTLVLAYSLDAPELKAALRANHTHTARLMDELPHRRTVVVLQHHNSAVSFRNIRIRVL
jgi:hypothetical protein